jgi:hypothetical protein
MGKTTIILSVVMLACFALLMAPGVIRMNQGKALRNIALWLAIFCGLGLIYKTFGPESDHPLFSTPYGVQMRATRGNPNAAFPGDKTGDGKVRGSQGFTPPGE